jgi:hypothetical protein
MLDSGVVPRQGKYRLQPYSTLAVLERLFRFQINTGVWSEAVSGKSLCPWKFTLSNKDQLQRYYLRRLPALGLKIVESLPNAV